MLVLVCTEEDDIGELQLAHGAAMVELACGLAS